MRDLSPRLLAAHWACGTPMQGHEMTSRHAGPPVEPEQERALGKLLRRFRERAGLTQEELAERAGLTAHGISALERGIRRRPYPHTLRTLAAALGLSESDRATLFSAAGRGLVSVVPTSATPPTGQLPVPLTPLIGREDEVIQACQQLRHDGVRLLTLTGPGGVGKTRLAIQIGSALAGEFADGVAWVALDAVRDWRLVALTVARALGLQENGQMSVPALLKLRLQSREMLLVLDNVEHVLPATALIAELLAAAPRLRILATSRAQLGISGEHLLRLGPLAVPDLTHDRLPSQVSASAAVQLFLARGRAIDPGLTLTAANAPIIAEICARLDGLPLAIELAAVRLAVLSPQALLARLSDRLTLLTGGARDQPDRLRMIRSTLAWSYDLLSAEERALFRRLAVFAGGFTLEAAEAVAGLEQGIGSQGAGTKHAVPDSFVLDRLASLVGKSLVQRDDDHGDELRFRMLETIRDYGIEHLRTSSEDELVHQRHAAWCLALAREADAALDGPDQAWWLNRLEREHANLRVALRWLCERDDLESALTLVAALSRFWWLYGHCSEGRAQLEALLSRDEARAYPGAWATAMTGLGSLQHKQGYCEQAVQTHQAAVAVWREIGDPKGLGRALWALGFTLLSQASPQAESVFQEGLLTARAAGDGWGAGASLWGLGRLARLRGNLQRATELLEQSFGGARDAGNPLAIAATLLGLAEIAHENEHYAREAELLQEALLHFQSIGEMWGTTACMEGVAAIAATRQRPTAAARLFGAASALRGAFEVPVPQVSRLPYERVIATICAIMGEAAFAAAWQEGQALTIDQGIADALAEADRERAHGAAGESITLDGLPPLHPHSP